MGEIAIHAEGLSKRYRMGLRTFANSREWLEQGVDRLFRKRTGPARGKRDFWALKNVSLEVRRGEVVGIIGRNGAGKSTLLKILSRITRPTSGFAEIHGRMGSLLEVGTGFHPELTGRENIFLNGAVLGMSRVEIRRKFDEIVDFAGIEQFLSTPVKRYSSGMYVRLAFAIAAHLEPEILIVDEVLAVGDAAFQRKCLSKLDHVAGEGRTVLLVSHNLGVIQSLCRSALLLRQGEVQRFGPTKEVADEYLRIVGEAAGLPIGDRPDRVGQGMFRFLALEVLDADGQPRDFARTGEDLVLRMRLEVPTQEKALAAPLDVAVMIRDSNGHLVTTLASFFTGSSPTRASEARVVTCTVPKLSLLAGQYTLDLWAAISSETQDHLLDAATLHVEQGNFFDNDLDLRLPSARYHGACVVPQIWHDGSRQGGGP